MELSSCIYCKNDFTDIEPSDSDIIPTFLGGNLKLRNAVCKKCNNVINSEVEMPIRDNFRYIRSGLGIKGRRKKHINVQVEVEALGKKLGTDLDFFKKKGIPPFPFEFRNENGRKHLAILGDQKYVYRKRKEIESNTPNKKWEWREFSEMPEINASVLVLPFSLMNGEEGKRLAAKIAFERLCQKKGTKVLKDRIYDEIREYVLYGKITRTISCLTYNEKIMEKNLALPFPNHAIVLSHDVKRNRVIGVVSLFGLYYYLVLISTYLPVFSRWDDCIIVHPQELSEDEPFLHGTFDINIPNEAWHMDEKKLKMAREFAFEKFQTALKSVNCIVTEND